MIGNTLLAVGIDLREGQHFPTRAYFPELAQIAGAKITSSQVEVIADVTEPRSLGDLKPKLNHLESLLRNIEDVNIFGLLFWLKQVG